jgi:DNA-binding transcriptional regulator YiaG
MPNVHTVLKEEIARVARKEIKAAVGKLRDDNQALKRSISALKRELASQDAELKHLRKQIGKSTKASAAKSSTGDDDDGRFWVTSNGIKSLRKKLGLTQAEFAELLGVSGQAVYQWEAKSGTLKVRSKTREAIIEARKLNGSKAAKAALEEMR